ncbi:transmembrane and TPR repeat-containing protein CG4050-like protein, partial [Dinothrombium tinctorium]
ANIYLQIQRQVWPLLSSPTAFALTSEFDSISALFRNVFHYILITIVTVVCYWPSLYGELVFDDKPAIIDNKDVRRSTPLYRLFLDDYWGMPMHKDVSHKSYRPLTVLTFRLNYLLHGLNPIGYHVVNIGLHALASILVHKLCMVFEKNTKIALSSALLFAVHPIHTDAVGSVVGRSELLSAIFYESSLLIHFNSKTTTSKYKPLLTLSLTWIGFLCKEQCLTVLVVCALFDIIFSRKSSVNGMRRIPILFSGFIFALLLRMKLNGNYLTPCFNKFDNPASVADKATKFLTYTYLGVYNFWLLTFPFHLCCDWTHESIALVKSYLDSRNVITVAFFATLCYILLMPFVRRKLPEDYKKTLMFILMLIIPFIPASNLFFNTGFVIAERVLYLPSIGFVLLVAFGAKKLYTAFPHATISALMLLLVSFGAKTYNRCNDWQNELSLFKSGLKINPRNVKLLNNVGRLLERRALFNEAVHYYKRSIELEPMDIRGFLNLGNLYVKLNELEKAEKVYEKVDKEILLLSALTSPYVKLSPGENSYSVDDKYKELLDSDDLYNLAIITRENGRVLDSLKLLDLALERYPYHESSLLASARIIYDQGLQQYYTLGIERLHTVIAMGKASDVVYFQLGMLSIKSKDYESGKRALSKAIDLNANFSEALYNLALLLYNENAFNQSMLILRRLLHINNKHLKASILLCDIHAEYHRDFHEAERCYRNALTVDRSNSLVKHNLCVILVQLYKVQNISQCLEQKLWRAEDENASEDLSNDDDSRDDEERDQETHKNFALNDETQRNRNKSSFYLF